MRKLIISVIILAFIACNNQPTQKATTNIQRTEFGFANLKGKPETIDSKTVNFDSTGKAIGDSTQSLGTYDNGGNLVKETIKDNLAITTIIELAYYANGFNKEEKRTVNGTVQYSLTIDSVVKGQHTGVKIWDSAGKQVGYCDAIYNEFGQVTWSKIYMNGKLQFAYEAKYDGPRWVGSSKTDSTGKIVSEFTRKLNDKDDPAEEQYTTVEEGVTTTTSLTYKYDSYDEKGNWTQQSTYKNDKLISVTKRAITYYKD